ncbi:MAG: Jag N-terminal domain-containing protein [Acetobacter sp.]|nr:Jag N-terminal domain-containing protein [Bacteroides sp.]MCM1340388.1 Jag N-terminal domain-containing protein [Acetobacter sp.]MCM1432965.1 Jag N-terminal domain-containing protein [Clostridiales bacterium]
MIKEFIGTGKTIEEATASARSGLNAPESAYVNIEVIQMPKKKLLGLFGGCDAQVKASYDDGRKEKKQSTPKPKKQAEPKKKAEKKPAAKNPAPVKKAEPKSEKTESTKAEEKLTDSDIDLDYACTYLKTIIDSFKVEDAKVTAKVVDGVVEMEVICEDYGIIIGRRGETLDSLQYLVGLALKNSTSKYVRVTINVGDYRAKREATLKALAIKNANFVVKTGRRYTFEPMNPYERRIIHTAVQEVEGAVSRSVGSGMERKVVVEPEGGVRRQNNNNRRRNGGSSYSKTSAPDPNREKRVDRADIPKFGKIEINKD